MAPWETKGADLSQFPINDSSFRFFVQPKADALPYLYFAHFLAPFCNSHPHDTYRRIHSIRPRVLFRQSSSVRLNVAWYIDFKDNSKSHSIPPIEVVCPESPPAIPVVITRKESSPVLPNEVVHPPTLSPPSSPLPDKSPAFIGLPAIPFYLLPSFDLIEYQYQLVTQTPEQREATIRSLYQAAAEYVKTRNGELIDSYPIAPHITTNTPDEPDEESNDLLFDPVLVPQQPDPTPEPDIPSVDTPDQSDSIVPHQTCVLPYSDRHERPLAIERVVLIAPTIASDNTQGKGSRYKSVAKYPARQVPFSIADSNPAINTRRL